MVFLEEKNILNHYHCSIFKDGCPNSRYFSDEMYKFPACMEIEPTQRCYKAEPSCQTTSSFLNVLLDTTSSTLVNETSNSSTADPKHRKIDPPVIILCTIVLILLLCISSYIAWKKKWTQTCCGSKDNIQPEESIDLLEMERQEKIEADIDEFGIEYLLQELPRDTKMLPIIAKKLSIPQEILHWSLDDRHKFVTSMKDGNISVYNSRGIVIGCARAGKTTLVKKLRGARNLTTESTSGIEIHSHLFKLNADETAIIACAKTEKNKGYLCLSPATLERSAENKKETSRFKENELLHHPSEATSFTHHVQAEMDETAQLSAKSTEYRYQSNSNMNDSGNVIESLESTLSNSNLTLSKTATPNAEEHKTKFDFSDCLGSVDMKNLKMLSLLDFAGHSAYYACHHIFFSPRAFFILVVDMTKNLESEATESCKKRNLIYSNWTYADYVRYWLGSIHTYSSEEAPVILVASHAEGNGADPNKALEYVFEICNWLPKKLKKHLDKSRVFSTEKNSNKNMENLKRCIASTMKAQSHWGEKVPIFWTKLESMLMKLREGCKIYHLSHLLQDVQNMSELRIENEEDLIIALTFFHETGVILFQSEIKDIIILDVQWFVDAFKCIILDEEHMNIKDIYNFPEFNNLNERGLLSTILLNTLWKDSSFFQHRDSLVNHMKQLDMLAELSEEIWYVPCMNKLNYPSDILQNCDFSSRLCFLFEFLPFVIYHRLVAACINNLEMTPWESKGKMCIFHKVAILCCKNSNLRVLIAICDNSEPTHAEFPYSIEIQTNVTNPEKINTQLTSSIKIDICQYLTDVTRAFPSCERSFDVGYRCRLELFGRNVVGSIIKEDEMSKPNHVCSKCSPSHTVDVGYLRSFWEEKGESILTRDEKKKENEKELIQENAQMEVMYLRDQSDAEDKSDAESEPVRISSSITDTETVRLSSISSINSSFSIPLSSAPSLQIDSIERRNFYL
ncbi:uncharacterized protein LOC111111025 isoform X2 [Crassostrea virginica]